MKKVLLIITIFFSLLLGLTANATTPNYATDITESSSIAEDFKSMGKDLNSYSANLPDNYLDYFGDGNCFELVDFQVALDYIGKSSFGPYLLLIPQNS